MKLLVADGKSTWRDYVKPHRGSMMILDPSDANHGAPARISYLNAGKVLDWSFVGSTDAARNPLAILVACTKFLKKADDEAIVLLFPVKNTPLHRQLALKVAQMLPLSEVLIPLESGLEYIPWPLGAESIELPEEYPTMVIEAQRRARWLELMENSYDHFVPLNQIATEGCRLGSGKRVKLDGWVGWAEVSGDTLLLIGYEDPSEEKIAQFMDYAHARKVSVVDPSRYEGLICAFSSQEGEDFGMGIIESFDPTSAIMKIKCNAVVPAPLRILRLGQLRVDSGGKELPLLPMWSL